MDIGLDYGIEQWNGTIVLNVCIVNSITYVFLRRRQDVGHMHTQMPGLDRIISIMGIYVCSSSCSIPSLKSAKACIQLKLCKC